ncbi:MAG: LytR/AlgR family response regulator transcription factor [Nocardioidaceae bacterium]
MAGLQVLVVDDELPIREELGFLLDRDERVSTVIHTGTGAEALKHLEQDAIDAVFLDIAMPGLSGLDVARVLAKFKQAPAIVFVTAHEEHAVEAFEINAVDYLLKPVRQDRVSESVRRVVDARSAPSTAPEDDETIAVERGGVTRFIRRSDIRYVESHGDYVRLHTTEDSHLLRVPLATLEEQWHQAGFVRIHRQCLVAIDHVSEVRQDGNHCTVLVDGSELVVSRRHTPELRELLVRRSRPNDLP